MGKKTGQVFDPVEIVDIADKGKAIGRCDDGRVILVENAVPGDIVAATVVNKKKGMKIARASDFHRRSEQRTEPFCIHFDHCGGCSWQNMTYEAQLEYKENAVRQKLIRIAGLENPPLLPILGAERTRHFRNKLEFTFTRRKWLELEQFESGETDRRMEGLGFHIRGSFAHVLDVEECHLMNEPFNRIRNSIRDFAVAESMEFQDLYHKTGLLRNLTLRCNRRGEFMAILVFRERNDKEISKLLDFTLRANPEIISLYYCINPKLNDSYNDLELELYNGQEYIEESLDHVNFRIGPKSFFQTNPWQAENLIGVIREIAELKGDELIYDLYTGIGTIGLCLASSCRQVVGIEEVAPAIEDAWENAAINNLENLHFICGDVKDVLSDELVRDFGRPDLLITDPPRAGMHPDAVKFILRLRPPRIIYVSCNPSTQARDIALLSESYTFIKSRPVDMFPHTSHIENVALLNLK